MLLSSVVRELALANSIFLPAFCSPTRYLIIVGLLGVVAGYANIYVVSWLQGNINANFRGSVMSALVLGSTGLAPISLAVSGVLVQLCFPTLFVSAGVTLALVAVFMALRSKNCSREATVALADADR